MKCGIVSGYFNPLHGGHLDMIEDTKNRYGQVLVIVNNDKQQLLKKEKIIMDENERFRIIEALKDVDLVILSKDKDETVCESLKLIGELYQKENPDLELIFCNGGDRRSPADIPESEICEKYDIKLIFDIGGSEKTNSSTKINKVRGEE